MSFRILVPALLAGFMLSPDHAVAQPIDMSKGGPVTVTSRDGIDWQQAEKVVIARGDARAVRGDVTVTADRLIARYRPKPGSGAAPPPASAPPAGGARAAADPGSGSNEIYRLEADGNVRIFTATDVAVGDHATYDMDQAVLLLTGRNLKLTRPAEQITARDSLEYWSQLHRAVARGDAVVLTAEGKRLAADTLVAYTSPPDAEPAGRPAEAAQNSAAAKPPEDPLGTSGRIQKVEAFGNVSVRTQTETVTGDRGVYVPETGIARLGGNVRITRGQNQLNGAEAEVDMKTGLSRLISGANARVQGLVMPNDASVQPGSAAPAKGNAAPATTKDKPR